MKAVAVFSLVLSLLAAAAAAQDSAWRDGDADTRALIDELRALIDEAAAARAADPRFLEDLRAALGRHQTPWSAILLADDFGDGDYTRNPDWRMRSGSYFIDSQYGLRSRVAPPPAGGNGGFEDLAATLKRIVQGAPDRPDDDTGGQPDLIWAPPTDPNWAGEDAAHESGDPPEPAPSPAARSPDRAEISTAVAIGNAFSLRLELRAFADRGQFMFGPYQGVDGISGYRLGYAPGRGLELLAVSRRGVRVVAAVDAAPEPADGAPHRLQWDRWPDGAMAVSVDGRERMRVTDRGFGDRFDGVTLINAGGDFAVRAIQIRGTP